MLLQTRRQLEAKKAECDSLHYRLKVVSEESRAKLTSPVMSPNMSEQKGFQLLSHTSSNEQRQEAGLEREMAELTLALEQ